MTFWVIFKHCVSAKKKKKKKKKNFFKSFSLVWKCTLKFEKIFFTLQHFQHECLQPSLRTSWIMLKAFAFPPFFCNGLYPLFHSVKRWRSFVILPRQTICLGAPKLRIVGRKVLFSKVSRWCLCRFRTLEKTKL